VGATPDRRNGLQKTITEILGFDDQTFARASAKVVPSAENRDVMIVSELRKLGAELGSKVEVRHIDITSQHSSYNLVSAAEQASKDYYAALDARTSDLACSSPDALERSLLGLARKRLEVWGEQLKVRDAHVMQEIRTALGEAAPNELHIVMVGATHARQARGFPQVIATLPESLLKMIPQYFAASHSPLVNSMKIRKASEDMPLNEADLQQAILTDLLQRKLQSRYPSLKQRFENPTAEADTHNVPAEFLASMIVLRLPAQERERLFKDSILALAKGSNRSQCVADVMGGPINTWIQTELGGESRAIPGFVRKILLDIPSESAPERRWWQTAGSWLGLEL
jgi:hypothetical protein